MFWKNTEHDQSVSALVCLRYQGKGKGQEVLHVVGGLCHGVSKLRGPEEGDPQVEWILIGSQNLSTGVLR